MDSSRDKNNNIESIVYERFVYERFAKPSSLDELGLTKSIEKFCSEYVNDLGHYCEYYVDKLADVFYELLYSPNNASNGIKEVRRDQCRLIKEYREYLNQNISDEQKEILKQKYPSRSKNNGISNEEASYLWCEYPDEKSSCAALYEKNLMREIKEAIKELILAWEINGTISYIALNEKIPIRGRIKG